MSVSELSESVPGDRRRADQTVPADTGRRTNAELRRNIATQCGVRKSPSFYRRIGKRVFDLCLALPAVVVLALPLLLISMVIRLDSPGPAIFKQRRTGQFGRRFSMYKFRSMVDGAEQLKGDLLGNNVHGTDSPDFKLVDDPRVTRLGQFLRKTSIDELPNLLNVVRGEMSLVGPRPTSFESTSYDFQHLPRLSVKPGITGVWQVSGRANVNFDRRTRMDQNYISNISLRRDLQLVIKTLTGKNHGAY